MVEAFYKYAPLTEMGQQMGLHHDLQGTGSDGVSMTLACCEWLFKELVKQRITNNKQLILEMDEDEPQRQDKKERMKGLWTKVPTKSGWTRAEEGYARDEGTRRLEETGGQAKMNALNDEELKLINDFRKRASEKTKQNSEVTIMYSNPKYSCLFILVL